MTQTYKIFRVEELKAERIFYQSPKKILYNNNKFIFIPIVYKLNENTMPVLFQLPSIKLNDSYKKDILLLPINTFNKTKTELLKNFLNELDEKLIQDFKNNGKKWCADYVQYLKNIEYKALVNLIEDNDPIYDNGVLNLQLEDINNFLLNKQIKNTVRIYNEKKEIVNSSDYTEVLQRGNIIQCILELKGLIIQMNNETTEIFPYIKTHQIRFTEERLLEVSLESYSFLDSEIEPTNYGQINNKSNLNSIHENNQNQEKVLEEYTSDDSDDESDDESNEDSDENSEENSEEELESEKLEESEESDNDTSDDEILKKIANDTSSSEKPKKRGRPTKKH